MRCSMLFNPAEAASSILVLGTTSIISNAIIEKEEGNEMDGVKGGAAAAQSKKVGFLFVFFCVVHFC